MYSLPDLEEKRRIWLAWNLRDFDFLSNCFWMDGDGWSGCGGSKASEVKAVDMGNGGNGYGHGNGGIDFGCSRYLTGALESKSICRMDVLCTYYSTTNMFSPPFYQR